MIERNIGRTTAMLRGYLHAAYQAGMRAENDPTAPDSLLGFGIEFNPVAAIPALSKFNKVGERNLNDKELGRYVRQVRRIPNQIVRSAMLLALLLGGQRMEQLLRVTAADLDLEGQTVQDSESRSHRIKTVTLRDPKGRRVTPRIHLLPIHGEAEALFIALFQLSQKETPLFTNDGKIPLCANTTSHAVTNISKALEVEKLIGSSFCFGDLRRTCETLLAGMGISKDIRAQIQSHGLGGVQDRHYDKYRYLPEKSEALKRWTDRLTQFEAEVTNVEEEDKVAAVVAQIQAEKKLKDKLKAKLNANASSKGKG